jgi:membrane-associated phospholipid phosphatase
VSVLWEEGGRASLSGLAPEIRAPEEASLPSNPLTTLYKNAYAVLTVAYFVTLLAFCWDTGVFSDPSISLLPLAAVPLLGLVGQLRRGLRSWLALVMIAVSYEVIAEPMDAIVDSNGVISLFGLDKSLWGLNFTGWVQSTFYSAATTDVTSLVYLALVPIILGSALVIWRKGREDFGRFVAALVLTSYFALVTFILIPTAPPWFNGVATNLVGGPGLQGAFSLLTPLAALAVPDYFASFPSLHVSYTLICAFFLYKTDGRLGTAGALLAVATLFSTLYLGQHFVIDLIGGAAYAVIPCVISTRLHYPVDRKSKPAGQIRPN